ncbi:hypothetical protein IW261DRAFT_1455107 [Armillaria novae-zelandiae]|uniref:F-box domain-containing protein n=1 Tax=Armillaria novae-zelandiae TaxID=153914 RepID=A0AA39PM48_9AGAR|nr:hypothetical protein IW261DRAFT_1455107 [Armillaria novae-zelandiae]
MAPPRRSQHEATKRTYKDIESEPEDDHSKDYAGEAPVKKPRVKKVKQDAGNATNAAPKHRRLRGLLQKVAETPLDILFEIFSKLDPLDLLRLTRTTKDLRALLLQRSSTFVWKRARQNIEGLPPLPEDLSEPKFAHLAFDKYCENCLRYTPYVQWEPRTKFCRKCLTNSALYVRRPPEYMASLVPSYDFSSSSSRRFYHYYVPTITALLQESESLSGEMRDAWVLGKRDAFMTLQIHARLCDDWDDSRAEIRSNELEDLRARKLEQVIERLTTLGWDEELQDQRLIDELACHKLVRQSQQKLLTERAWSTMSDPLISIVKQHRKVRLLDVVETRMSNFRTTYNNAIRDVPLLPIYPKAVDAAVLKPFSKLLFDTPLDQDITESVTAALAELPRVADKWRETQNSSLQALMLKAGLEPNLILATSFFKCNLCHLLYQYPYVLAHRCLSSPYPHTYFSDPDNWKDYALDYLLQCERGPIWSVSQYKVDGEALKRVQSIIQACGLNPETATHEDMESLNCRVTCSNDKARSFVMQWQIAACHEKYPNVNSQAWRLLDDARELERVKILEKLEKVTGYRASSYSDKFICSHCTFLRGKGNDLEQHLLEAHGVDRISADDFDWPVGQYSSTIKGKGVYLDTRVETDTTEEARSRTYFIY